MIAVTHPRPPLAFATTITLTVMILAAGYYDPTNTSQTAYLARSDPAGYWASSVVWLLLLAPIWLPSCFVASRFIVPLDYTMGVAAIASATFVLFDLTANAHSVVFVLAALALIVFGVWHLVFAWHKHTKNHTAG